MESRAKQKLKKQQKTSNKNNICNVKIVKINIVRTQIKLSPNQCINSPKKVPALIISMQSMLKDVNISCQAWSKCMGHHCSSLLQLIFFLFCFVVFSKHATGIEKEVPI